MPPKHPPSPPTGDSKDYMIEVLDSTQTDAEKLAELRAWVEDEQ